MKTCNQPCHHPVRWLLALLGGFLFLNHLTISQDSLQGAELADKAAAKPFNLTLRKRVPSAEKSSLFNAVQKKQQWNAKETAVGNRFPAFLPGTGSSDSTHHGSARQ